MKGGGATSVPGMPGTPRPGPTTGGGTDFAAGAGPPTPGGPPTAGPGIPGPGTPAPGGAIGAPAGWVPGAMVRPSRAFRSLMFRGFLDSSAMILGAFGGFGR